MNDMVTIEPIRIINRWREAYKKFEERGLGTRVAGEVSWFFNKDKVRELLRYEYALHRVLDFPMEALCAYDIKTIVRKGYTDMIMPLVRAHGKAIFASQNGTVVVEPENIEDRDVERLLEINI